jgi:hypothetical protein
MTSKTIVKTSKHTTKFANTGKRQVLAEFLAEYRRVVGWVLDYVWDNEITWEVNGKLHRFDIKNNKLNVPKFISTANIPVITDLSARAVSSATSEALSVISSQVSKRARQLYVLNKKTEEGDLAAVARLQAAIDKNPLVKPTISTRLAARFDSNCCQFIANKTAEFDGFLKLHAIGKKYGHIYIPVKFTKHSNGLATKGYTRKTSWQIAVDSVASIWEIEKPAKSTGTRVVGMDQGMTTCLSLSDGQTTSACNHGHDLASIGKKIARKKKGSKAFKRAQSHRTNYINWSIGQLNLDDIKEVRLEKLIDVRKGKRSSKYLNSWTYTEINAKVNSMCQDLGVPVIEQSSVYRSQRCSDCGWTQKSNRAGKQFVCKQCGVIHDADINGACNHAVDLYQLPFGFSQLQLNRAGFYWLESGLFDVIGQALTVPDVNKV